MKSEKIDKKAMDTLKKYFSPLMDETYVIQEDVELGKYN